MTVKLKRIKVEPESWGSTGYTYYETQDGRFRITKLDNSFGDTWQITAMNDFDTPFQGFRGKRNCKHYNADLLTDCRWELDMVYDIEARKNAAKARS